MGQFAPAARLECLQSLHVPLDNENIFLLNCCFQFFLESLEELPRGSDVARHDTLNHDFVSIRHSASLPEALIWLREERHAVEEFEEPGLKDLEFHSFDGRAVVVIDWNEEVIFFHPPALLPSAGDWIRYLSS